MCLHTSYIKVHTHEICKYGIQKPVKTLTYVGGPKSNRTLNLARELEVADQHNTLAVCCMASI